MKVNESQIPWRRGRAVLLIGVWSLLLLWVVGYSGISNDLTQYILPAVAASDAGYLVNDWFVQQTTPYHPLFHSYTTLAVRFDVLGELLFAWHCLTLVLIALAVRCWTRLLGGSELGYFLVLAPLALGIRGDWWGQHAAIGSESLASLMGISLAAFVWWAAVARRALTTALTLGATFYIHFNAGMWAAFVVFFVLLFDLGHWKTRKNEVLVSMAVAVAAVTPLALWVLTHVGSDSSVPSDVYNVLFYGRAPHHYVPHLSSAKTHLNSIVLIASYVAGAAWAPPRFRRPLLGVVTAVAIACASGFIFTTLVEWPQVVRMFPFRLVPTAVLCLLPLLTSLFTARDTALPIRITALFLILGQCWLMHADALSPWLLVAGVACTVVALRLLLAGNPKLVTGAVAVTVLASALPLVEFRTRGQLFEKYPRPDEAALFRALQENTPADAIIAIPPQLMGVRYWAKRAVVVNLKCMPMRGGEIEQWRQRMLAFTGVDPGEARSWLQGEPGRIYSKYEQGYNELSATELEQACRKYNARYLLVERTSRYARERSGPGCEPQWGGGRYVLFDLRKLHLPCGAAPDSRGVGSTTLGRKFE